MNVVSQTPVIVTSPTLSRRAEANKGCFICVGVTELTIGILSVILGGIVLSSNAMEYYYSYNERSIGLTSGAWYIVAGILALTSGARPSQCNVIAGIVISILASLAAFGACVWEGAITYNVLNSCYAYGDCQAGFIIVHGCLSLLGFIEFIMAIVHSSYCCGCCGVRPGVLTNTATVTTTTVPSTYTTAVPSPPYVQEVPHHYYGNTPYSGYVDNSQTQKLLD